MNPIDREGDVLAPTAVRAVAIAAARELISAGALEGWDRTAWTMVVTDVRGRTVLTLPFSEAVKKQPADSGSSPRRR